jgi:hypothetical protein
VSVARQLRSNISELYKALEQGDYDPNTRRELAEIGQWVDNWLAVDQRSCEVDDILRGISTKFDALSAGTRDDILWALTQIRKLN